MTSGITQDRDALRAALDDDRGEVAGGALAALGRLLAGGAAEDELARAAPGPLDPARIAAVLDREEITEALEVQAIALITALDGEGDEGGAEAVLGCFEARDRAELERIGAAFVQRSAIEEVGAGGAARLAFDLAVRTRAFELVAHNAERARRAGWIVPAYRARFWWWFEGQSLDPRGVTAMSAVAALVARWPEGRERFEQLVAAEQGWAAQARSPARSGAARAPAKAPAGAKEAGAKVIRLRDWVERRGAGEPSGVALAAAPLDEVLLLETEDAHVSWAAPGTLIVDLLSDRRPSGVPELVVEGAVVPGVAVPGAEERFAFALGEGALDGARAVLRLPLARGDREIALPPPEGA